MYATWDALAHSAVAATAAAAAGLVPLAGLPAAWRSEFEFDPEWEYHLGPVLTPVLVSVRELGAALARNTCVAVPVLPSTDVPLHQLLDFDLELVRPLCNTKPYWQTQSVPGLAQGLSFVERTADGSVVPEVEAGAGFAEAGQRWQRAVDGGVGSW